MMKTIFYTIIRRLVRVERRERFLLFVFLLMSTNQLLFAQNPIVQTNHTADPAPLVHNGRLYLYTSHDEEGSTWFTMNDWKLYSTADMVNWTDHGSVLSYKTFNWAKGDAWAIQCIERDGKFYLYAPVKRSDNNRAAIGVAVADNPSGPFYDVLGEPLVQTNHGDIDPTVFIDDDGQAYLYWGNPVLYYVKLNRDMISFDGPVNKVPMTGESFGIRKNNPERPTLYEEGPWLYKKNKRYYLLYAGGPIPEHIGYATSKSPVGPWKYEGVLMPTEGRSFTNHPAMIDFKGKTYFFYHNGALPGGNGFNRSVAVEEAQFDKQAGIVPMKMTTGIKTSLEPLNPFIINQAETIAWSEGVKALQNPQVGVFLTAKHNDTYTVVRGVDFKQGVDKFIARVSTTHPKDVHIELRLDSINGKTLATLEVPMTGGSDRWTVASTGTTGVTGIHDLYFVFKGKAGSEILYFDYWRFTEFSK